MWTSRVLISAVVLAALNGTFSTQPASSTELPQQGLVCWLSAEKLASEALGSPQVPLGDGAPVRTWIDAGNGSRTFQQPDATAQPILRRIGENYVVRFDGEDDHLQFLGRAEPLTAATLFIVAAPHENAGDFRGFWSVGAVDGRDYETGFNVDLGPGPTLRFEQLNLEGTGFGGARNLLNTNIPFGNLVVMQCTIDPESKKVRLAVDGKPAGDRPLESRSIHLEQMTVGARYYTNGPGKQQVRGSLKGDIAEVVLYDRVLSPEEQAEVHELLANKYRSLKQTLPQELKLPAAGSPLVKVENPPAIQMLVPGFEVIELPVELTNINNVRFREDGTLVTLGYNGDVHLLRDSDGDGVEDTAAIFWKNEGQLRGPIGMQLTPPSYVHGEGLFVPSKGKVSFLVDTDGDDRADEERVIASGWTEIPQNVDAVGIAMDDEGALYFALGTANYANAYLVDEQGKAAFDIRDERGTVQRIAPDFSSRETICTGVRFPVALAINEQGDLFCTDQEGATWLPNGNPFDELLHIQRGRHYGFPPRHPAHNPDVIDEPSTFDYAPQHQSTCGLFFNRAGENQFGPAWWRDQAIVCGESRGKLWRTQLVPTANGYVAASQLFACLQMLTVDACVAPNGDLVVACHSGPPDWGTGPAGIGKLFRIRNVAPETARPIAAWAASAREIQVAFDRPLRAEDLKDLADKVSVEYGSYVRAGDRFEHLVPPYAVVQRQAIAPRFKLAVHSVSVTPDLRTLVVTTDPMRQRQYHYSLTLSLGKDQADLRNQIDLDFSLGGVHVEWQSAENQSTDVPARTVASWIPHLDLQVARALTAPSEMHQALWSEVAATGNLKLTTQLDLHHILRPQIQPNSTIDYQWPAEEVTLRFVANQPFTVVVDDQHGIGEQATVNDSRYQASFQLSGDREQLYRLVVDLACDGEVVPELSVSVSTNEDDRQRSLPLHRFVMPWAEDVEPATESESPRLQIAELEGGNWGRGRKVFHSEAAGCFKCHAIGGIGASLGPDLANLVHRDYQSVVRDVVHPSYAINPDYINHSVLLEDGRVLTGVLQSAGEKLLLGDAEGKTTEIWAAQVDQMKPLSTSAMPTGLLDKLNDQQRCDLFTYLLTPAPSMPLLSPLKAPPLRTRAEVTAALADAEPLPDQLRPLQIVLVAGAKDHGPGEHDYPAWQIQWGQLLSAAENVEITMAWDFPSDEQLATADCLIFFQKGDWTDVRAEKLDAYQQRGGGSVYIHWAVNGNARSNEFAQRIGLASHGGSIRYRHGELTLHLHNTDDPILRNLDTLRLYDESYWLLSGNPGDVRLLASSVEDGMATPQVWTYERGRGRVFVSIPGHYSWTFDDPLFRILLLRGIAWTMAEPLDRFNELVPLGARIQATK